MNDKRQPDEQPEPETVRQHILAALKRHPTLRVRIVRSLQIALHSRGIVSVEQIQDEAEQQMPAPHTNAREPADDNAPQAARWDKYQREVMLGLIVDYAAQHFTPTEIDDIVNLTHKRDEAQALEEIATLSQIPFGLLKQKVKDFGKATYNGFWALLMPVIEIGILKFSIHRPNIDGGRFPLDRSVNCFGP